MPEWTKNVCLRVKHITHFLTTTAMTVYTRLFKLTHNQVRLFLFFFSGKKTKVRQSPRRLFIALVRIACGVDWIFCLVHHRLPPTSVRRTTNECASVPGKTSTERERDEIVEEWHQDRDRCRDTSWRCRTDIYGDAQYCHRTHPSKSPLRRRCGSQKTTWLIMIVNCWLKIFVMILSWYYAYSMILGKKLPTTGLI